MAKLYYCTCSLISIRMQEKQSKRQRPENDGHQPVQQVKVREQRIDRSWLVIGLMIDDDDNNDDVCEKYKISLHGPGAA